MKKSWQLLDVEDRFRRINYGSLIVQAIVVAFGQYQETAFSFGATVALALAVATMSWIRGVANFAWSFLCFSLCTQPQLRLVPLGLIPLVCMYEWSVKDET